MKWLVVCLDWAFAPSQKVKARSMSQQDSRLKTAVGEKILEIEFCVFWAEDAVGRKQTKTHLSQFFHRVLAYPILFEHDLRRVDDIVNRLLDNATLQCVSWFSDGLSAKDWESMSLARAN